MNMVGILEYSPFGQNLFKTGGIGTAEPGQILVSKLIDHHGQNQLRFARGRRGRPGGARISQAQEDGKSSFHLISSL
jgi:hypothetical protein